MAKSHWSSAPPAPSDRAAQTLRAQPGYEGSTALADSSGRGVSVAFFATAKQAESAQAAASAEVSGTAHAATGPDARIAWINYAGGLALDRSVGNCAASVGG